MSRGGVSRWRGPVLLFASGVLSLLAGGVAAGYAFFAYLAANLDETGEPQIADSWWMAFVLWGGIIVMVVGPLLCWLAIPLSHWVLHGHGRGVTHEH